MFARKSGLFHSLVRHQMNHRPDLKKVTTLALTLAFHANVNALTATIPPNSLCDRGHFFTGQITAAQSLDCKTHKADQCSLGGLIIVQMQVDRVLKTTPIELDLSERFLPSKGKIISMYIYGFTYGVDRDLPTPTFPTLLDVHSTPTPITDEWLQTTLLGRIFVFEARAQPASELLYRPYPLPPAIGETLLHGNALPMAALPLIEGPLRDCKFVKPVN